MKISVERVNWTERKPELVVLVGDPYSDYIGSIPDSLAERLRALAEGFQSGRLKREVQFQADWGEVGPLECLYFHTSSMKGFTATETLKTFLAKALRQAMETGKKRVAMVMGGPQSEGIFDQLVEGALVGTFAFREYKKDSADPYADLELVLVAPAPPQNEIAVTSSAEVVEESGQQPLKSTVSLQPEDLEQAQSEAQPEEGEEAQEVEVNQEESSQSPDDSEQQSSEATPEPDAEVGPESEPVQTEQESEPATPDSSQLAETTLEIDQQAWTQLKAVDESALQVGRAFADGVNLARTLVGRPANDCTPDHLAKVCKKLAATHSLAFQSFGPKQLEAHGYAGMLAVGKGADHPPRMIEMTYTPAEESNVHLVLVGKGVTFDSGGISIKGADKMHLMVGDMAGAAAVIGAMETLGRLKPEIKVTALIVSAENKPSSKSYRPGDIIRYKNGVSVHVENTDAEGRLILADGLIRAGELGATHIIDIATLTGACARALGPSFTGVMGANRKLVNAITRAGGNHGESYWRLPMPVEYQDMLKSVHADINNVGGPYAGATTAALFLKEFVPSNAAWVHLDIAGTFWKEKPWKYYNEGPSGTGVKTIADLALRWREHVG